MTVDANGNVTSYDDYDPWGMQLEGRSANYGSANEKYKFLGKERDVETGYDWLDARGYDARIGRFLTVDPFADKGTLRSWSPYHYSFNNPIIYLDPNGREIKYSGSVKEQSQIKQWIAQIKSTLAGSEVVEYLERPGFIVEIGFGQLENKKKVGLTTSHIERLGDQYNYIGSKIILDNKKSQFRKRRTTAHEIRHAYQAAIDPKGFLEQSEEDAAKSYYEKLYEQDAFFFENIVEDQYKQNDKGEQKINNNYYYFPSPGESPGNIHYMHSQTFLIHNIFHSDH